MAKKENLILALLNEGVEGFMDVEVPDIPDLPEPSATDSVQNSYVLAAYAVNCNKFLQCFEGLHILDFLLRGLQRSNPMIALAMASLEAMGSDEKRITILSPSEGQESEGLISMLCQTSSDIVEVTAQVAGGAVTYFEHLAERLYRLVYVGAANAYNIVIGGIGSNGDPETQERNATITNFYTYPVDGASIPINEFFEVVNIDVGITGASNISRVEVQIDGGDPQAMTSNGYSFVYTCGSLEAGAHTLSFNIYPNMWSAYSVLTGFTLVAS